MEQQLLQKILVIRETLHRNINKSEELYKILPDDLFKQKYVKEDKSVRKIAEELNLSYGYTLRRLKEINILRDKSDSRKIFIVANGKVMMLAYIPSMFGLITENQNLNFVRNVKKFHQ